MSQEQVARGQPSAVLLVSDVTRQEWDRSRDLGWAFAATTTRGLVAVERFLREHPADMLVVELTQVGADDLARLRYMRANYPALLVLIVATPNQVVLAADWLATGAHGCVMVGGGGVADAGAWPSALAALRRGELPIPGVVAQELLGRLHGLGPARFRTGADVLTDRERAVLACLARGDQYKEIARALAIRLDTVREYIRRLYRKLGVDNRTAAVGKAGLSWGVGGAKSHEHATSRAGGGHLLT
jgi:DNA-binding NarL/FixJ family response regulator